jgi:hypothetical protein
MLSELSQFFRLLQLWELSNFLSDFELGIYPQLPLYLNDNIACSQFVQHAYAILEPTIQHFYNGEL